MKSRRQYAWLFLLMLPGFIWYLLFHLLPLYGIVVAFQDYRPLDGIFGSAFVGLKHFRSITATRSFGTILRNTLVISSLKLLFGFPAPILLALSIHAVRNTVFKRTIQTITYLPHFLSWVVVTGIVFAVFNEYFGVLKILAESLGLSYLDVSTHPDSFIGFLVASSVWKSAGWGSIIYLASLASIDAELYEAAQIDGAGPLRRLISITVPLLMPTCAVVLILSVGGLLSGDFEQIFLFAKDNNVQLVRRSEIFETFIYRNGIRSANFSFPAAVGLFQSCFGAVLILLTNRIAKKFGYEGLW